VVKKDRQPVNKRMAAALLILAALPVVYLTCAFAQRQASRLRRVTPAVGKTITVRRGDNLQRALNAAQPGDEVVLEAGATYTGNFVLPVKSGDAFVTVRSSRCTELPAGQRVGLVSSSLMARLATPNVAPVLLAPIGSHHFRFQCLEFTQGAVPTDSSVGFAWGYNLIQMGEGASYEKQKTVESVPHHFEFDRVIVRTRDSQTCLQRGITLNSASTSITNSYIADIKWPGTETQAIAGWNGPGPYLIENNYLEAAGMSILFGGAPTAIPGLVPSDITIRRNTLTKRLEWKGQGYGAKNLFELKNARRVTFTDNDCQYSWPEAQSGWAVILNAFRDSPQNVVDDVEIGRNVFRDVGNGINIRGMESDDTVTRTHRINVHDNLIENIGAFAGEGKAFQVLNGTKDVWIDHNTVRGRVVTALMLDSLVAYGGTVKHQGLKFTNNLVPHGLYGIFGNGGPLGTAALNQYASEWEVRGNALYALPAGLNATQYPAGNYFPPTERLAAVRMGTDKLPVGVRAQAPTPAPASAPTSPPTPTSPTRQGVRLTG
jgi:hypothetical protein